LKRKITPTRSESPAQGGKNPIPGGGPKAVGVDLKAICSIDHECVGCSVVSKCCCAMYDVCVSEEELQRIIPVLPEAAELCPHLKTEEGYANVFEEAEKGHYAIDTHENGLCVFAYKTKGLIRCSLHAVEAKHGLPLGSVKPGVCILWPLTFSEDGNALTLHDNALSCECSSPRKEPSKAVSPALIETIRHFGGEV
jgi:hypothetical protein